MERDSEGCAIAPCFKGRDHRLVSWDIDSTGRSVNDEMFYLAAYTPSQTFSQYILPCKGINPAARCRHGVSVVTIGRFRALKDTANNAVLKTKTERATLQEFVSWLENVKKKDGVILVSHEGQTLASYILLQSLRRYELFDCFSAIVKGFVNSFAVAEKKCGREIKSLSLTSLAQLYLQCHEPVLDAASRAALVYDLLPCLLNKGYQPSACESESSVIEGISAFVRTIAQEEEELKALNTILYRQETLRPIFLPMYDREKYRAQHLERLLAKEGIDYEMLYDVHLRAGFAGILELIKNKFPSGKLKDIDTFHRVLFGHFEKRTEIPRRKPFRAALVSYKVAVQERSKRGDKCNSTGMSKGVFTASPAKDNILSEADVEDRPQNAHLGTPSDHSLLTSHKRGTFFKTSQDVPSNEIILSALKTEKWNVSNDVVSIQHPLMLSLEHTACTSIIENVKKEICSVNSEYDGRYELFVPVDVKKVAECNNTSEKSLTPSLVGNLRGCEELREFFSVHNTSSSEELLKKDYEQDSSPIKQKIEQLPDVLFPHPCPLVKTEGIDPCGKYNAICVEIHNMLDPTSTRGTNNVPLTYDSGIESIPVFDLVTKDSQNDSGELIKQEGYKLEKVQFENSWDDFAQIQLRRPTAEFPEEKASQKGAIREPKVEGTNGSSDQHSAGKTAGEEGNCVQLENQPGIQSAGATLMTLKLPGNYSDCCSMESSLSCETKCTDVTTRNTLGGKVGLTGSEKDTFCANGGRSYKLNAKIPAVSRSVSVSIAEVSAFPMVLKSNLKSEKKVGQESKGRLVSGKPESIKIPQTVSCVSSGTVDLNILNKKSSNISLCKPPHLEKKMPGNCRGNEAREETQHSVRSGSISLAKESLHIPKERESVAQNERVSARKNGTVKSGGSTVQRLSLRGNAVCVDKEKAVSVMHIAKSNKQSPAVVKNKSTSHKGESLLGVKKLPMLTKQGMLQSRFGSISDKATTTLGGRQTVNLNHESKVIVKTGHVSVKETYINVGRNLQGSSVQSHPSSKENGSFKKDASSSPVNEATKLNAMKENQKGSKQVSSSVKSSEKLLSLSHSQTGETSFAEESASSCSVRDSAKNIEKKKSVLCKETKSMKLSRPTSGGGSCHVEKGLKSSGKKSSELNSSGVEESISKEEVAVNSGRKSGNIAVHSQLSKDSNVKRGALTMRRLSYDVIQQRQTDLKESKLLRASKANACGSSADVNKHRQLKDDVINLVAVGTSKCGEKSVVDNTVFISSERDDSLGMSLSQPGVKLQVLPKQSHSEKMSDTCSADSVHKHKQKTGSEDKKRSAVNVAPKATEKSLIF